MHRFQSFVIADLVLTVLLMALYVYAGDEDCLGFAGQAPINCYKCDSIMDRSYCTDPFNESFPGLQQIRCKEYCVKWVRHTLSGKTFVQRTCSDQLQISFRKNIVCMQESRPSEGVLCLCDKEMCNTAFTLHRSHYLLVLIVFVVAHLVTEPLWKGRSDCKHYCNCIYGHGSHKFLLLAEQVRKSFRFDG